jgi:hypothetical protein
MYAQSDECMHRERDTLREQLEALRGERETMHRVHDYEHKFKEGISIEYLKNVLIKYIETQVCRCDTQKYMHVTHTNIRVYVRETMHRVHDYEHKFKEGISIEYLKNVLIKYIETQVCRCACDTHKYTYATQTE